MKRILSLILALALMSTIIFVPTAVDAEMYYSENSTDIVVFNTIEKDGIKYTHAIPGFTESSNTVEASDSLPQLQTPTNLRWNIGEDGETCYGMISWKPVPNCKNYLTRVFRDNVEICNCEYYFPSTDLNNQSYVYADINELGPYGTSDDTNVFSQSGAYTFSVQALGDNTNYSNSGIITSSIYNFICPLNTLSTPNIKLNGKYLEFSKVENAEEYGVIYYDENFIIRGYACLPGGSSSTISYNLELEDWLNIKSILYVRVCAISGNIEEYQNSPFSDFSPPYYINGGEPGEGGIPTINWNYDPNEYNYDLALECAELSAAMYGKYRYMSDKDMFYEADSSGTNAKKDIFEKYNIPYKKAENLSGVDKEDGINSIISHVKANYNGETRDLVFVACRGTSGEEWYGNMDITGKSYDSSKKNHDSFQKAASGLENKLEQYIKDNKLSNAMVVVTGHSRGAAVANLTAYDLSKGKVSGTDKNGIYGYTFACPSTTQNADTSLKNIYNFCFADDFVPAFPLGAWGYGKHGETHRISAELLYSTDNTFKSNMNTIAKKSGGKSPDFDYLSTYTLFNYVPTKWKNIKDYYTAEPKKLLFTEKLHLYTFCHDYLAPTRIGGTSTKEGIKMISGISSSVYEPIVAYLLNGVVGGSYLNDTHQMYTYYEALKTGYFDNIEWIPQLGNSINFFAVSAAGTEYNSEQVEAIKTFLNYNNNAELLGWDANDPATWDTIIWNAAGNAESVSFYYTGLSGDLDLSGFSDLKTLICPGNNITSINLDGCDSLEALDCSKNVLTELDVNSSVLIALNCNGNYLDTENMTKFQEMENNGVMVSCDNQNPRENAAYDETDVSILKNALSDTNIWDLSAEPQNWYGIDWEKQNGVYRCVGIDIRGLGVVAPLDLSGLNALRYLYCSYNKLDSLDISGCGSLENLCCSNCELRELNIDNTAISFLNCEENYFDAQTQEDIDFMVESVGGESLTSNQLQHIELNLDDKYSSLISASLEYSGENIYLTISSLNGTDISENIPTVIHASYDGELMTAFEVLLPEKKDNGNYIYTDEIIGGDKIMLWDNLNNMQPLTEPMDLNF